MVLKGPIGIFDSGYGGLTVLREIVRELPDYDYVYLGDNARAPYGTRSFETVYDYTLECVRHLFAMDCSLVVLACNTASAKALRNIQQKDLPQMDASKRVLGVIRPTTELAGNLTKSRKVGVLATSGTVSSGSYPIEIKKFFPDVEVFQEACPMWVPLIENGETGNPGAEYFFRRHCEQLMQKEPGIDLVILGCTHYPLISAEIRKYLPGQVQIISQGPIVARSLKHYLERHPEMEERCSKGADRVFYTTDQPGNFDQAASLFFGGTVRSTHLAL